MSQTEISLLLPLNTDWVPSSEDALSDRQIDTTSFDILTDFDGKLPIIFIYVPYNRNLKIIIFQNGF